MQYFNFSRLINKYMDSLTAITFTSGEYDDTGKWVENEPKKTTLEGAIISFRESKVYRSEGTLTAKDKRLFTLAPIDEALKGSKIVHENKVFSIEDNTENAKYTGVYAYTLRYVSAFGEDET